MGNHMSCVSLAAAAAAAEFQQQSHHQRHSSAASLFHEDGEHLKKKKNKIMVWALQQQQQQQPPPARRPISGAADVSVASVDEIEGPVSAGDVMVDHPGHFLCCVSRHTLGLLHLDNPSLRPPPPVVAAVPADQDLKPCCSAAAVVDHVYLLLPMARLRTRFSPPEIQNLRRAFQSPPSPQSHHESHGDHVEDAGTINTAGTMNVGLPDAGSGHERMQLYLRSRSWVPRLETITESVPPEYNHQQQKRIQQYSTSFSHHMQRRRLWAQTPATAVVGTVG